MTDTSNPQFSRRNFFASSTAAVVALAATSSAPSAEESALRSALPELKESDFSYEITRTEAEWRARLSETEYEILRGGRTEKQKTSPLWNEAREGSYHCKGCDHKVYDGHWKTNLNKGWAFFFHSETDAVLTGIDGPVAQYGQSSAGYAANMEVHCRRCGSHLGHLLIIENLMRHCINGTALNFYPSAA